MVRSAPIECRYVRNIETTRRNAVVTPVEIAWRRSSRCGSTTCVEIGRDGDDYLMRDSKNPDQPALRFGRDEWLRFLNGIQAGDLRIA